ncbi:unnamed protein product [Polarella glacialis]|uniref:Uncharacterized protein n=1 Tax=Polarella glacialis TaxID=89957 RepID=A0A813HVK6_POLGL|nr:unnamed protein product [Polarella glacialis]
MGANCTNAASSILPCLPPAWLKLKSLAGLPDSNGNATDEVVPNGAPSKIKILPRHTAPRGGPLSECGVCSLRTQELAKSSEGRLLCRSCVRAEDQRSLGPLTAEESKALDLVSGVLDCVSWNFWKPGVQPAQILDWLYLGDVAEATDLELLEQRGIRGVLNLIGWWELAALLPEDASLSNIFAENGIDYEQADSEDRLFFDIIESSWPSSDRFLNNCKKEGRKVLVNCQAGHNRSACMVVCWLLVHEGKTLLQALDHVQKLRGTVLSNHGFRLQLVRMALQLGRVGEPAESSVPPLSALPRGPQRRTDLDPELGKIINRKRLSFKYGHNSNADFLNMATNQPNGGFVRKTSVISEEVNGLISQRKLSKELLASLFHFQKNMLEDYEYTADPPVVVGTGFSGDVLLCYRRRAQDLGGRPQNSLRCVKNFNHKQMIPEHLEKLKNEAVIYLSLEHPHVARLFDVYEDEQELSLVMQYCGGGTLQDVLKDQGPFSESDFRQAAVQMLRVLKYIHKAGIVHRDIKPRNWVYESERQVLKLIDFGFSAKTILKKSSSGSNLNELTGCMGTLGYLAPEVVSCATAAGCYTEKCDVWSLGVVFLELLSGEPVYEREKGTCDGYTEEVILRDIQECTQDQVSRLLERVPVGAREFLGRLLTCDQQLRPSVGEVLLDAYLDEERARLSRQPSSALAVTEVLARFQRYGATSAPTRASLLAMARAPTRLPWNDFCALRATFDIFDAPKLNGSIDFEAFLAVVVPSDALPGARRQKQEALKIWQAVCGEEEALSYCEFLAALIPMVEDAFMDVSEEAQDEDIEMSPMDHMSSSIFSRAVSGSDQVKWDVSQPVSAFLPLLKSARHMQDMLFAEDTPVREVVGAMSASHFRWAVIRFRSGRHEFFDYMDISNHIVKLMGSSSLVTEAVEQIGSTSVGVLANCSGYSYFMPKSDSTPLKDILELLAQRASGKLGAQRVPLMDVNGELTRVFSCMDFLELALRFDIPSAVLKSHDARTFDRRKDLLEELSVPHDETVLHALRMMDAEKLTICPATSRELSGNLGGAVAVGVVAVADLKWVIASGEFDVLNRTINEFICWRNQVLAMDAEQMVRHRSLRRFNVVSVDKNETLHVLASRLLASKLQRIFLSSDEIARIVGIVSSRDILVEVLEQLLQASSCISSFARQVTQ